MDNYEVIETVGKGSFGSIYKIRRIADGKILVWKEICYGRMNEKEKQQLVSEVNILRELRHPHIVRYYDRVIDKTNTKIYIVMEYCSKGDISQLIKKCKKTNDPIGEEVIWKIFMQILLALHTCHSRPNGKILHRDIKPGNVFLDSQDNVKLGDFGLSKILGQNSEYATTHVGTPYYMSPEQINEANYNEKSDIWSLGCLLYEMCSCRPPFEARTHMELAMKIRQGKFERIPNRYSEEISRVIKWMLNLDQNARPTVDELLNVPFVSLRVREKRLRIDKHNLMKIEEQLKEKEKELKEREENMKKKERELIDLERRLCEQLAVLTASSNDSKISLDQIPSRIPSEKSQTGEITPQRIVNPIENIKSDEKTPGRNQEFRRAEYEPKPSVPRLKTSRDPSPLSTVNYQSPTPTYTEQTVKESPRFMMPKASEVEKVKDMNIYRKENRRRETTFVNRDASPIVRAPVRSSSAKREFHGVGV